MPGRMGGDKVTSQSLNVLKVDEREGLIYVAGVVPGNKSGFVRMRDAIKKIQKGKCFPAEDADVPYPSNFAEMKSGWEEGLAPEPKGAAIPLDPFLRVVGEKM
jgi:large subunit ribosomal protein L3